MSSDPLVATTTHVAKPVSGRDISIFLVVGFGLALLTRVWTFPLSAIGWDESDYLIVSRDILNGVLPYQGAFDHKPVALYYLFALAQLIFEQEVYSIRILAVAFVGGTAFLISLFLRKLTSAGNLPSVAAGAVYALTSVINDGFGTNTEILINLYFVASILLANTGHIAVRSSPVRAIWIGALLSLMFHTNYLSGILILGFCAIYLIAVCSNPRASDCARVYLSNGFAIFAGFVAITTILLAPIALWGDLGIYFGKQAAFLGVYKQTFSPLTILSRLNYGLPGYFHLLGLAASVGALLAWSMIDRKSSPIADRGLACQMIAYLAFALAAYLISGRYYPHYLILSLPALSMVAGLTLTWTPRTSGLQRLIAAWLILTSVALVTTKAGTIVRGVEGYRALMSGRAPDTPARIAGDLKARLLPEETIYVYDYHPIVYYLTNVEIPTHYPFSELHLSATQAASLGFRPDDEVARIMALRPRFVIAGSEPDKGKYGSASLLLSEHLNREYQLVSTYAWPETMGHVWVYERNSMATF